MVLDEWKRMAKAWAVIMDGCQANILISTLIIPLGRVFDKVILNTVWKLRWKAIYFILASNIIEKKISE